MTFYSKSIRNPVKQCFNLILKFGNESVTAYQMTANPNELVFQYDHKKTDGTESYRAKNAIIHSVDANIRESLSYIAQCHESSVVCEELSFKARVFESEEQVYLSKERRLEFLDKKWSDYIGKELHIVVGYVQAAPIPGVFHDCGCAVIYGDGPEENCANCAYLKKCKAEADEQTITY